jgi:hypothetical protein
MKIQELRWGNIVADKDCDGNPYTTEVGTDQLEYPHNCEPITPTNEILLSLGFSYQGLYNGANWYIHKEEDFRFRYSIDLGLIDIQDWDNPTSEGVQFEIKAIHQIQNIFFDLTGKELTISS